MTAQEVYDEATTNFNNFLVPAFQKAKVVFDLLAKNEDESEPGPQSLQESFVNPTEKGMVTILDEFVGNVDKYCIFMDLLKQKMDREAPETEDAETSED